MTVETATNTNTVSIPKRLIDNIWLRIPPIMGLTREQVIAKVEEISATFNKDIDDCMINLIPVGEKGYRLPIQSPEGNSPNEENVRKKMYNIEEANEQLQDSIPFENLNTEEIELKGVLWREFLKQVPEGSRLQIYSNGKVGIFTPISPIQGSAEWLPEENYENTQITFINFESWLTKQTDIGALTPRIYNIFLTNDKHQALNVFKILKLKDTDPIWFLPQEGRALGKFTYKLKDYESNKGNVIIHYISGKIAHLSAIVAHEVLHKKQKHKIPKSEIEHGLQVKKYVEKVLSPVVAYATIINSLLFVGGLMTGSLFAMFAPFTVLGAILLNSYKNLHDKNSELGKAVHSTLSTELDPRILNTILSWKLWEKGFIHSPDTYDKDFNQIDEKGEAYNFMPTYDWYLPYLSKLHRSMEFARIQFIEKFKAISKAKDKTIAPAPIPVSNVQNA